MRNWSSSRQSVQPATNYPSSSAYYSSTQVNQQLSGIFYQPPKHEEIPPTEVSFDDDLVSYPFVEPLEFDTADLPKIQDASLFRSTFTI